MSPFMYWTLCAFLAVTLVLLLCYLVLSIVWDLCVKKQPPTRKMSQKLSRYHFEKSDIEDLTRMEGDFKAIRPNLSFKNEVDDDGRVTKKLLAGGSKKINNDDVDGDNFKISAKGVISQSVDNLEFCDPDDIDVLKLISSIEEKGKEVEEEVNNYVGTPNDVKYYEINEKFIKLMIAICEIYSEKEEIRRRKNEVYNCIEECQKNLKSKRI